MLSFKSILSKYKFYVISFFVFATISNLQIKTLENKFNNLYEGINEVKAIGTIISDRKETAYKASYTVRIESINSKKRFNGTNLIIYVPKSQKLEYGDKIVINGTFEKANTARNYKEFDYREYLKSKNIYGIVNVDGVMLIKKNNLNFALISINNLRMRIKSNLQEILGKEAEVTIRNFTSVIYRKFRMKLSKILKIVAYITFWQYLAHTSGFVIIGLTTCLNAINASKRKIKLITAIFLIFFMALTGFTSSVVRACTMSIIILLSRDFLSKK